MQRAFPFAICWLRAVSLLLRGVLARPLHCDQRYQDGLTAGGGRDAGADDLSCGVGAPLPELLDEAPEPSRGAAPLLSKPWMQRCNIKRLEGFPLGARQLPSWDMPYIVSSPRGRNARISQLLQRDNLLEGMGNVTCTPSRAGSTRRGIEEMLLRDYVEHWMTRELRRHSEENRYVFGEFGDQWAPLREAYELPPCQSRCARESVAITIGLGGLHSGAPWHFHDGAFVEIIHGAKHFALLPPYDFVIPEIDETIKNLSQFHWHEGVRPAMEEAGRLKNLQECSLSRGDLLYFPDRWHHGAVNLAPYTAFVSTFLERSPRDSFTL